MPANKSKRSDIQNVKSTPLQRLAARPLTTRHAPPQEAVANRTSRPVISDQPSGQDDSARTVGNKRKFFRVEEDNSSSSVLLINGKHREHGKRQKRQNHRRPFSTFPSNVPQAEVRLRFSSLPLDDRDSSPDPPEHALSIRPTGVHKKIRAEDKTTQIDQLKREISELRQVNTPSWPKL